MKRQTRPYLSIMVFIGLLALMLTGCGGGGGSSDSAQAPSGSVGQTPTGSSPQSTGNVSVYFPAEVQSMAIKAGSAPTTANRARLVIKKVETRIVKRITGYMDDDEEDPTPIYEDVEVTSEVSRIVADGVIPGFVSAAVPPGLGYTIEILTYAKDAPGLEGFNYMLKYVGPIGFDLLPGVNTEISLTQHPLQTLAATLVFPEPFDISKTGTGIVSGFSYSLPIADKGVFASVLRNECFYNVTADGFAGMVWYTAPGDNLLTNNTYTFVAPTKTTVNPDSTNGQWPLEFQGQFFISSGLLGPGENWSNWRTNLSSSFELTPSGSIGVTQ